MHKISNIIITVLFIGLLSLPIIDDLFNIYEDENFENRVITENPSFEFPHLFQYFDQFDKYYNDNFGLRDLLFKNYTNLKYYGLNISPLPQKVIIGDEGWFFLGDVFNDVVTETFGYKKFSEEDLKLIKQNLENRAKWLNEKGIEFYVGITPNKHTIYSEYLPIPKSGNPSKFDNLFQYLNNNSSVQLIDMKEDMLKDESQRLFHKTNTHWNELGAFYGYNTLIEKIQGDFPKINVLILNDFTIEKIETFQEDLTKMLNLNIKEERIILAPNFKTKSHTIDNKLSIPDYFSEIENPYEIRIQNPDGNYKAVIFRDSFSIDLIKFLQESFEESVYIWDYTFDEELIIKEQPDIVIFIIVERNIDVLKNL